MRYSVPRLAGITATGYGSISAPPRAHSVASGGHRQGLNFAMRGRGEHRGRGKGAGGRAKPRPPSRGRILALDPTSPGPIDLRWDGAVYYVLGTSLAEGRGYRLLNEPGEVEAVQYPPVLPAIVAAVQMIAGTSDSVRAGHTLRLLFLAFSLAYVAASYVLARRMLAPGLSLLVGTLVALHFNTLFLSDLCFTEIPFGLVTVLFVLAARSGSLALTGALGAIGVLLRSSGLALFAAWVGEALVRRRLRQAALRAAIAAVPILAWQAHVSRVAASPQYRQPAYEYQRAPYQYYNVTYAENLSLVDPFRPERGRITACGGRRPDAEERGVSAPAARGGGVRPPQRLADGPASRRPRVPRDCGDPRPAAPSGLRRPRRARQAGRSRRRAAAARRCDFACSRGGNALAAAVPTLPRLARPASRLGPGRGPGRSGFGRRARLARAVLVPVVVAALAMQVFVVADSFAAKHSPVEYLDRSGSRASLQLFFYSPAWRSYDQALQWLRAQTDPAAIVGTADPHVAFLRTGRKAVLPPMEADIEEAQRLLDTVPVAYLVIDEGQTLDIARRYGEPVVRAHPERWELVYDRGVRIYRRRGAPGSR